MVLIDSVSALQQWLASGAREPATLLAMDLTAHDGALARIDVSGCIFLACRLSDALAQKIRVENARVIDELGVLPDALPAFAGGIYTVAELYAGMAADGTGWENTPDYAGFLFFNEKVNTPRSLTLAQTLAARLHDTVQQQAVDAFLRHRNVVAIMGGHDFKRRLSAEDIASGRQDVYWECVQIAKDLTEKGFLILTGGGPGLMEAGNLGALLAHADTATVHAVRALLTEEKFDSPQWRATAMAARARILGTWDAEPAAAQYSLGIPTWLYGHEPPNLFASHHSKMFYNSLREDGLVTYANKGIIFFEGNAGTVQEVFQDLTQNYYLGAGQAPTPMVFYNAGGYWERSAAELSWPTDLAPLDKRKPLLPLVKQLAVEKKFVNAVFVTRKPDAVVKFLVEANSAGEVHKADVHLGNTVATG